MRSRLPREGVAGAVVRLAPLLALGAVASAVLSARLTGLGDEQTYLQYASNLTHGYYADVDTSPGAPAGYLWHGPGLPALLAPLVALDAPVRLERALFGPLLLFAALVAFHRVVDRTLGPRWALGATVALGLYAPLYHDLAYLRSEPLALLLVVLALLGAVRYLDSGRRADLLLAGGALGALAMARLEYGWVVLACLALTGAWALARRGRTGPRRALAIAAVATVVCIPWLTYTLALTGRPLYWGNSGGLSLYWMASRHGDELGDWHSPSSVFADSRLAHHRPFFAKLRRLDPVDQDRELQEEALELIRDDPAKYGENLVANGSRLLFNFPYSFEPQAVGTLFYAVPNSLLLGILALAIPLLLLRRGRLPPAVVPAAAFAALVVLVHLPVAAEGTRMLLPAVPIAIWLCAVALAPVLRVSRDAGASSS